MNQHAASAVLLEEQPDVDSTSTAGDATESIQRLARVPVTHAARRATRLIERLREPEQRIDAVYRRLAAAPPESVETSRGAEWLLDNHHIIRRAFRLLRDEFPPDFERRLPRLTAGELRGYPRVYAVAIEIATASKGPVDLHTATPLLNDFQSIEPLTIAEVWALPAVLRLVVLEVVATAVDAIVPASVATGSVTAQRAREVDETVATCIRSLRMLETTDWKAFVEGISAIEQTLRTDPANVYGRMDFATRDRYRKAVEELASRSGYPETAVAAEAIRVARLGRDSPSNHVGHHLVSAGRYRFERQLGYRPRWRTWLRRWLTRRPTAAHVGGIALLTLAAETLLVAGLLAAGSRLILVLAAALLSSIPACTVAVSLVNGLLTRLLPPSVLPKMDFETGIPADCESLVAVPALLASAHEIEALVRGLEIRFLANQDARLHFALLMDFVDAPVAALPEDEYFVQLAEEQIRALNARYGADGKGPFHLFHRPRRWCRTQAAWMGWERKRGKLTELNRLLLGVSHDGFSLHVGDASVLSSIRFVITLDADTELPRGAASRLVGTLAHPLNRAQLDPASGAVISGYTVLQPRIEVSPVSTESSWFAKLFASGDGLDPYTRAVSDVYQDLFGEGVYTGKGIYDVQAFERSLANRVPEESLLSHDLFEGVHGRAGLVTDIVLVEDYPSHYLAFARRVHRWTRGDWQLLPWLRRRVPDAQGGRVPTRLSLISRWKILDNLRRSLLPPSLFALLVVAWLWFPGSPALWTLFVLSVPAVPGLTDIIGSMLSTAWSSRRSHAVTGIARALRTALGFWIFEIAFLPHQAAVLLDAIVRTVMRVQVTRKRLLEWTSAAHTVRGLLDASTRWLVWREMAAAPLAAVATAGVVALLHPVVLPVAAPLILLWVASPEIAIRISRPRLAPAYALTAAETQRLRTLARRTWAFFETFVGPEDQWLPPDHFQEDPRGVVARRTSPTNIGLLLLATVSAYDLGFRGLLWVILRLKNTLDTIGRMERYRGHLLNWYDTATLEPLLPRYVSTVDSGNLVACLIAVKQSCLEYPARPLISVGAWDGFLDTLDAFSDVIDQATEKLGSATFAAVQQDIVHIRSQVDGWKMQPLQWQRGMAGLFESCAELDRHLGVVLGSIVKTLDPSLLAELRVWSAHVHRQLDGLRREIDLFIPWLLALSQLPALLTSASLPAEVRAHWETMRAALPLQPTLAALPSICTQSMARLSHLKTLLDTTGCHDAGLTEVRPWIAKFTDGLATAAQTATYALERLAEIGATADAIIQETEFKLLYDRRRRLFYIGYNVTAARLDENHYDLLASEARLTSFMAIAKGEVPEEHWLHLGRPVGRVDGTRSLLSWSGTMFEYLMPRLLLREGHDTLIGQSCAAAVAEQIAYARQRGIPWGVSESGYFRLDAHQNYQYRAFGVPALGFKRGLEDELVVTPYASVLALPFQPREVLDNLSELRRLGMWGRYGLYESIDFTWSRLPPGQRYSVVRSFMAHHQGMILTSLNNLLNDDVLVRRFHAEPVARTAELLLYERPAARMPLERTRPLATPTPTVVPRRRLSMDPWPAAHDGPFPQAHVLSNGHYSLLVTAAGAVSSRWRKLALTRWTADTTLDESGFRIYMRDAKEGAVWPLFPGASLGQVTRQVFFQPHLAELQAHYDDIVVRESITVAPNADVEVHYLTLSNEGSRRRRVVVTSYAEVALNDAVTDRNHPAFSKLFVESEYVPTHNALLFRRRSRSPRDQPAFLLHMVALPNSGARGIGYETSREQFLGRGGTAMTPAALAGPAVALSQTTGATLDPIMSLSAEVDLPPHRTRQIAFVTLVAESRQAALGLAETHGSLPELEWIFELARNHSEAELARLRLDPRDVPAVERMLSLLLYPHHALRAPANILERNTLGHSALWKYAISGDLPILLLRIYDAENIPLLHEILRAQAFWRGRGIAIDLVILNEYATGYSGDVDDRIVRTIASSGGEGWMNRPGGAFLIHGDQLAEAERTVLLTAARVVLDGAGGTLVDQVSWPDGPAPLPPLVPTLSAETTPSRLEPPHDLLFDNGWGGFTADGSEYFIHLEEGQWTPAPWANVVANPQFGFLVSEAGGGYSWAGNSGENRLTPWRNDPVSDTPGEALYLRDEETGAVWSPTPLPARDAGTYHIRHGAGYTIFRHASHDLEQELRLFVPVEDPVKIIQLTLTNHSERARRITATYYVEWVLGTTREVTQPFVIPAFDTASETLLARNPWIADFDGRVAFLAGSRKLHGFTTDRCEFVGRHGQRARPAALARIGLANAVRPGLDPCAAAQLHLDLAPGESQTIHFLLGQGGHRDEALQLVQKYRPTAAVESAWSEMRSYWDRILGAATARTPDPALNVMLNRWLLYQTLTSRVQARTGYYQSSGAFGFRDQLQDVAALVHATPELCRAHLLECARHQFEEGDVLHWWHPPGGAGIRSRCSDDLLWLPYITAHYVTATGDHQVLSEEIPFLRAEPLRPEEIERYGRFGQAERSATVYQHCLRAIEKAHTAGPHGLPLFGGGDWNDGMNRVGAAGRGESVWLGWFLYATLNSFAPLCRLLGEPGQADDLLRRAADVRAALEASAWDGNWYRRGYYDDGDPLGSATQDECQIDSLAQSWAVLSAAASPQHTLPAMQAVRQRLMQDAEGLILLLAPPFNESAQDPGYIAAYPPGIRENGGQYTHAAVWFLWALIELGEVELAVQWFGQLLPVGRAHTHEAASIYRVEPYVLAADVYGAPPHTGRGGWTWYTGSAGWAYRFGWEKILGMRLEHGAWRIDPHIPRRWPAFEMTMRVGNTTYEIRVENPNGVNHGVQRVSLDDTPLSEPLVPRLTDGGVHRVQVIMG